MITRVCAKHPCTHLSYSRGLSMGHIQRYGCTRIRLQGGPLEHNHNLHSRLHTNDKNQSIIKPCWLAISTKDSQVRSHWGRLGSKPQKGTCIIVFPDFSTFLLFSSSRAFASFNDSEEPPYIPLTYS